jgi:hypothetical protein
MKELNMVRVRFAALTVAAALATSPLQAQQTATQAGAPTESLADLLLKQAQSALDALDRPNAEKFARQILEQMTTTSSQQKQKARFILANVYYPEEAPNARDRAKALAILKDAVRENIDVTIDRVLTWPGIDSILATAKATTFGMAAAPASAQMEATGPTGHVDFSARANRASTFRLAITGSEGTTTVSDSVAGRETTLAIPTMRNERPIFTSGTYQIVVTAIDKASGDSVSTHFTATLDAPALTFTTVPVTLDSTRFVRERTKKFGWKGIIVGGLTGGGIYAIANVMHTDTTLKKSIGPDSKGTGIAAAAGVTLIFASFLDKGRTIPAAIVANQKVRDDFAASIRAAQAENANRIATYKTTFVISTTGGK